MTAQMPVLSRRQFEILVQNIADLAQHPTFFRQTEAASAQYHLKTQQFCHSSPQNRHDPPRTTPDLAQDRDLLITTPALFAFTRDAILKRS